MPYQFQPDAMYRMPTHYGPRTGPRRGPDGKGFDCLESPKSTSASVSFLSDADQLEALLPPCYTLHGEPVVTVSYSYMKDIDWLAGRGYNTLGVSFPAAFNGEKDHVVGSFLTVLWENLADPIITGREELGFSKIYCELPDPRSHQGHTHYHASWLGFKFMDMETFNMTQLSDEQVAEISAKPPASDGTLHFKYMPRTGVWGTADIAYPVITPSHTPNRVIQELWRGEGTVQFHQARWEDLPTQYNVVNGISALTINEYRGATFSRTVGGKDLSDQRILE